MDDVNDKLVGWWPDDFSSFLYVEPKDCLNELVQVR